ncbi:MAG: malonate decarboxylase subunit epsilon [Burkholderiales bacterium]
MTLVVLFNGQGEQRREHVDRLLVDAPPDLATPLRTALDELGLRLDALTHDQLFPNRVAQPVICTYQLMTWRTLASRLPRPELYAGYSLGEVTAFACAGAFPPGEAVSLASLRARFMDEAVSAPSGLVAVLGLTERTVAELCRRHGTEIAIRNGADHFIVGGEREALGRLVDEAGKSGASKTTVLGVTTPSHTSMLASAAARFGLELRAKLRDRLDVPVLSGVDASVVRSGQAAAAALETQIRRTIDWAACMETIVGFHPHAVLEIGPGTALSRMLRELDAGLEVRSVDDFRSLEAAERWVSSRL